MKISKMMAKAVAGVLVFSMVFHSASVVKADSVETKSYISFGADLKDSEKKTVMNLLGVTSQDLENYEIIQVTNQEEKEYLGGYMDAKVIGSRALSSVRVDKGEQGSGIGVETKNITYCTAGMYSNALITAGVEDADVIVAGPFELSGTAALVGAMKSYSAMTGEEVSKEQADAAVNELVGTADLGAVIGAEEAAELLALAKQKVLEGNLSSIDDLNKAVEESAKALNIQLTPEQKKQVVDILNKIKDLDLDVDSLKSQAKDMYEKIKDLGIEMEEAKGFFEKIGSFFSDLGEKITKLFSEMF